MTGLIYQSSDNEVGQVVYLMDYVVLSEAISKVKEFEYLHKNVKSWIEKCKAGYRFIIQYND